MEVVPWRPACWRAVWYLLPSLLPARPRPTGPPCQRSGPGRPGLATGAGVSGDRRASLPTSARRVVCPPQPERASFRAVTLWQVGHLASGPPSPESPTALGTPPPPATQVGHCSDRGSSPERHCQPSPAWAPALPPPAGQGPGSSAQHHLSPQTSQGPARSGPPSPPGPRLPRRLQAGQVAAPWGRLDAALCSRPGPQTHAHRYPPYLAACFLAAYRERARPTPQCLEIRRKNVGSGARLQGWAPGPGSVCLVSNLGIFASNFFF